MLFILLATLLAVWCTGSNSEKTSPQSSGTLSQDKADSQKPASSATSQDA
jgi:hypothetical protein